MRSTDEKNLPCGGCPAGIYAYEAVEAGLTMFGGCESQKQALRASPRCHKDQSKICMGCRDFIVAMNFPIDAQAVRRTA